MKKLVLIFSIYFLCSLNVLADNTASNLTINMQIDENGVAEVSEEYLFTNQEDNCHEKDILLINDNEITDFTIEDRDGAYSYHGGLQGLNKREYASLKDDNVFHVRLCNASQDEPFMVYYKITNVVVNYEDAQGLNWLFLGNKRDYMVNNLVLTISSFKEFDENNTALYGIGDNINLNFQDGKIILTANNIKKNADIRLMTIFNDLQYKSSYHIDKNFKSAYNAALHENNVLYKMLNFVKDEIIFFILASILIIIISIIIHHVLVLHKKNDDYRQFKMRKNVELPSISNVPYYDQIPENKDLFKIYFVANYFNLIKNKDDLVHAIVLKWLYEGKVKLMADDDNYTIKLIATNFNNQIELELYEILSQAANKNIIDKPKMNRYLKDHYSEILIWYDRVFAITRDAYIAEGIISKRGKCYILNNKFLNIGQNIQGLKKYLLNFNQVPRRSALTEEVYLYLLVCTELLGIASSVSSEILRKNPDNVMAKQLKNYERAKVIFKGIYKDAYSTSKNHKGKL